MPGAIRVDGAGPVCGWHYGVPAPKWGIVTQVLDDWICVSREVNTMRNALVDPRYFFDLKGLRKVQAECWARMEPELSEAWAKELAPSPGQVLVGGWISTLHHFLGARVREAVEGARR